MKVLVTGSSRSIGKAICELFLKHGHDVFGFDILKSSITHERYTHFVHSISNRNYPKIDGLQILVNNAGIQRQSEEDILVNLNDTIALTENYAFCDTISAVVNVASASALSGSEFPHYAAAKGGLVTYTKNLALRLAKYKATANAVCPGGVITKLNEHILNDDKLYNAVLDEALLHKWAKPYEIAQWVYFLSCINKSMTGEALLIDNGEMLKANFIW